MSQPDDKTEVAASALQEATRAASDGTKPKEHGSVDDRDKQPSNGHGAGLEDLKVKSEFILQARAESLGPIKVVAEETGGGDDRDRDARDDRDNRRKKKGKRRGQNKKRPRDIREDASEKVCMAILRGTTCPFGENCKFSHDLKGYMAKRPSDITELAEAMGGSCPTFRNTGYCFYGAMCRVGSCHITKTGENVRDEKVIAECRKQNGGTTEGKEPEERTINSGNLLPRDIVFQLRKKTYPFECKRWFETKNDASNHKSEDKTIQNSAAIDPPKDAESKDTKDLNSPRTSTNASSSTPLDKLKIKKIVDFSNKIYVAPLTTVGEYKFCSIFKFDCVFFRIRHAYEHFFKRQFALSTSAQGVWS